MMASRGRRELVTRYFTELGERWQETYASNAPIGHHVTARLRCCAALLGDATGKRVLDLGCGNGAILPLIESASAYEGIDLSAAMVDATRAEIQARQLGPSFNVREGDVESLPFPSNHFDLVVGIGLLGFIDDPSTTIREALRVARPGGRLVFSSARRDSLDHLMVRAARPVRALLKRLTAHHSAKPQFVHFTDAAFQQLLDSSGCLVVEARHFDKRVLPYPFTRLWPGLARRSAALVEDWPALNACATGYIVACSKGFGP
jgi:ubiquinone/menaquinone biosynthesis C-methylase UbiE